MFLSLVFPVFNEEEVLPALVAKVRPVLAGLGCDYEVIFVNDGSTDRSPEVLRELCEADLRLKMLSFSRNFGHQIAITAGMDFASGDAVVVMDADLQDPPEILIEMVRLFEAGYHVVSAQRVSRDTDTWFKRATAAGFYWLMRRAVDSRLVPQVGDFRLFSRAAILVLRSFREQHRFMRGIVAWCGMKEAIVPFERRARAAGTTKYPLARMLRFAWTAISSSSGLPLRVAIALGAGSTAIGLMYFVYAAYFALVRHETVPGWASLVFLQVLFSGAVLLAVGAVGDYVARIYEEVKGRPLYVLTDAVNIVAELHTVQRAAIAPRQARTGSTVRHEVATPGK